MGKLVFTYEMEIREDKCPDFKEEGRLQLKEEILELLRPSNLFSGWIYYMSKG